jgi:hypothetical protein
MVQEMNFIDDEKADEISIAGVSTLARDVLFLLLFIESDCDAMLFVNFSILFLKARVCYHCVLCVVLGNLFGETNRGRLKSPFLSKSFMASFSFLRVSSTVCSAANNVLGPVSKTSMHRRENERVDSSSLCVARPVSQTFNLNVVKTGTRPDIASQLQTIS